MPLAPLDRLPPYRCCLILTVRSSFFTNFYHLLITFALLSSVPPILDSFIPILRLLPGFYLDENLYVSTVTETSVFYIIIYFCQHIRGSIKAEDWKRLHHYSRMVSKFELTDAAIEDSKAQISPAAFLRLARFQQHNMPFLPSLTDIAIVGADKSMEYLELLLTSSLKSLEASGIPDAKQPTFFSFLTAVEQEAPLLQTLVFGQGRYPPSSLQIIAKFNNLRHLELHYEDSDIPFGFFDNIGSLTKLETFILDARYVSSNASNASTNQPSTMNESCAMAAVDSPPSNDFPDFDSNRDQDGSDYVSHSQTCHSTPVSTSTTFNQLAKLHVVGQLPLLKDLITRITSTILQDVSVTIIQLSDDELRIAEEERSFEEVVLWGFRSYSVSSLLEMRDSEEQETRERLKEQQAHVYTTAFVEIIRNLCSRWTTTLKAFSLCQLDRSFQSFLKPPTLPEETFRALLLLPAIENLEVKGWTLDFVESVLNAIQLLPNLKSLLLPLDETNSGISLHALRHVAEICPKLESFQCSIESLSQIPEYPVSTTDALSHRLRKLSVGNSSALSNTKQLRLIARHLYLLFPHLETINTSQERNAEQWIIIDELVKICQMARMDDKLRSIAIIRPMGHGN